MQLNTSGIVSTESDFNFPHESAIFNTFAPYDNTNPVFTFVCDFLRVCFSGNLSVYDLRTYVEAYRKTTTLSEEQDSLFECAKLTLLASFEGIGPLIAIEYGRQGIPANIKPTWFEIEDYLVELNKSRKQLMEMPKEISRER